MSFFDKIGQIKAAVHRPTAEIKHELQLKMLEEEAARQEQKSQQAIQQIADLEWQKEAAANPERDPSDNVQIPIAPQSWELEDDLNLYKSYGQAGIDPTKLTQSQLFEEAVAEIDSPYARANLANGHEIEPTQMKDGVFYNRYDTQNPLLGTTGKHNAETRLSEAEARDAELRLQVLEEGLPTLQDTMLQIDAAQGKTLFDPMEVDVQRSNGQIERTLVAPNPAGGYNELPVTSTNGTPLKIPPQSEGSPYLKTDSPSAAWAKLDAKNSYDEFGAPIDKSDAFVANVKDWMIRYPDKSFPAGTVDSIRHLDKTDEEKAALRTTMEEHNRWVAQSGATPPKNQQPSSPATADSNMALMQRIGAFSDLNNQTSAAHKPTMPQPAAAAAAPPVEISADNLANALATDLSPQERRAALQQEGISKESIMLYYIDAVNQGGDPKKLNAVMKDLGFDLGGTQ